jgi:hypothetical protein
MAMDTHPILPQQLWNQTSFEVQVYIRALEARLESLEALEASPVKVGRLFSSTHE